MDKTNRIDWIDGLKGLVAVLVVLIHYLLMLKIDGFVGWNCVPEQTEKFAYYFQYFPYSILTNASFLLYIYFAFIAFIPSYKHFLNPNPLKLKSQAILRYFRFLPSILFICLLATAMEKLNLNYNIPLGEKIGSPWAIAISTCEQRTWLGAIISGFFGAYLKGSQYLTVLWCMNYIFIGSMVTYAFLWIFINPKKRNIAYIIMILICYFFPWLLSFVVGIFIADRIVNKANNKPSNILGILFVILGIIIGCFPSVLLPSFINVELLYGISVFFIIFGCIKSSIFQRIFSAKILKVLGKYSFQLILVHMIIAQSISSYLYIKLDEMGLDFFWNFIIVILTAIPLNAIATIVFDRITTPLTNLLCNWIKKLTRNFT